MVKSARLRNCKAFPMPPGRSRRFILAVLRSLGGPMVLRLSFAAALVIATCAQAAESRTYAVLSLIGDKLLVAQQQPSTGTNIRRTLRQQMPLSDTLLDRTALAAAEAVLRQAEPEARTVLLLARDPAILAAQDRLLDDGGPLTQLLEPLSEALKGAQATHLVVIAKHRQEAMLRLADSTFGTGKLEGLGFYVDHSIITENPDTRERDIGAIAPFAYLRIGVVDLAR